MSTTNVTMIRARVKDESTAEVDAAVKDVFSALEQDPPKGLHFASSKLSDGHTYVVFLGVEEGAGNPLFSVPAYREFQSHLQDWLVEPASVEQLNLLGSYKLF